MANTQEFISLKSVRVCLSRSEFSRHALKHNIIHGECNIVLSQSDFKNVKVESKKDGLHVFKTITLKKSDLIRGFNAPELTTDVSTNEQQKKVTSKNEVNRYGLRKRKKIENNENISKCPHPKRFRSEVVRSVDSVPKLLKADKNTLIEGLIVLAKMRTYAAWPARINSFKKTCVNVYFFGDETTGNIPFGNIGLFGDNYLLIKSNLNKKINGYGKAVKCAEGALKIPPNLSLFNTNTP